MHIQNFYIEVKKLLNPKETFYEPTELVGELDGEWLKMRLCGYFELDCQMPSILNPYGIFTPRYSFIELADIFAAEEQNENEI